ncbi:hypothetical protein K443DRAFT_489387 [Laccaria amethystina LaAM-08-1]|uniref:Uncharacterized protein n=1 Tax=Laccaria amethystina LaAM-08-1 TaxID=1095629 RepID=A0A0C9XE60_9AGAR|nr:hypothetical protein K443DRAFT_489387 [Laccaria amethystina LaAM-08-1]
MGRLILSHFVPWNPILNVLLSLPPTCYGRRMIGPMAYLSSSQDCLRPRMSLRILLDVLWNPWLRVPWPESSPILHVMPPPLSPQLRASEKLLQD